ncbi:MAG TPA: pyridoxal-phosphate dependent enzyme, partial [Gordonia sp. (in: high G+C Gram-positive bacteria)]|nr:pyridoxal-phosphate dependent enzyme [Gordonia sp. (in: high G+C Gram-positive bacteria)]
MRISRGDIQSARARIAGRLRRTPVLRTEIGTVNGAVEVALKLEFTQLGGSFKVRGSLNATLHAQEQGLLTEAGVLVASGGNAAIGAAHAARIVGVP